MSSKLDDMKRQFSAHADRSLGIGGHPAQQGGDAGGPMNLPEHLVGLVKSKDAAEIPVDRIVPDPDQPREHFDEEALMRLAKSIGARGVLQPLRVRWSPETGRYVLIAGERRWRAAQRAGRASVPCVIHRGDVGAEELLALQLIENVLREDLQPIEQAKGYRKLMTAQGWSASRLGKELAIPTSTVTRALELLDLPPAVQDLVDTGALSPSAACEVGRLERPEDQVELAEKAVAERLTKSAVVEAVRARKVGRDPGAGPAKVEIRFDDGHRITVVGPAAGAGSAAVVELLKRAVKKMQAEAKRAGADAA
ncbi:MAG: ParB/RepB/Spo0J family partition protein [Planctomycetaceae bacterium]